MGGLGSGGAGLLSDAEKKRRGTFRADQSDAAHAAKRAAKVVTGPWLATIPEPELKLGDIGRRKYDELTRLLFDQGKLSKIMCDQAEQVAMLIEQQHKRLAEGKEVPVSWFAGIQRGLAQLRIAEDAPIIGTPQGAKSRFAGCGFSNRRPQTK